MSRIRVLADSGIPFLKGVLEPFCDVRYLSGAEISHQICMDADALIIRTRTKCVASLLQDTPVSFIATATIGTDHMDTEFLQKAGIAYANAPGCNACGVMQYVHTALFTVAARKKIDLRGKVLGVIGAGNTGERVARLWEYLGGTALRNDIDTSLDVPLVPLEDLLANSDIVSCHLPLDASTRGMVDVRFLERMKDGAILVNACRGEIVEEDALIKYRDKLSAVILDVWNGEPCNVSENLMKVCDIATPHIAGYSYEGKINGTAMAVRALASHFGIGELLDFIPPGELRKEINLDGVFEDFSSQVMFAEELQSVFPIMETDAAFRSAPAAMEKMRAGYDYRHEFFVPERIRCL